MYAILKALGVGPGDEVIVPAYTCVVVPNAILYRGATPVYADIEPDTYTPSARTIEPCLTRRTRLIVAQNTFGLSADLTPILNLARRRNLYVIEDGAHGLGSHYREHPCGALTDACFFSTQWSKPVSTGLGGIAYSPHPWLAAKIQQIVAQMPACPRSAELSLAVQRLVRPLADLPALHYRAVDRYRQITQILGWLPGSSGVGELTDTVMPHGYCRRMSRLQRRLLERQLTQLESIISQRRRAADRFDALLRPHGLVPPRRPDYAQHGMLRYAFRVGNKAEFLAAARREHVPVGDWFSSPLHPMTGDLRPWNYHSGRCPVAERACREVVNLYTNLTMYQDCRRLTQVLQAAVPVNESQKSAA